MIRDPSDGSVREKPAEEISFAANEINAVVPKAPAEEISSGLPFGSTKSKDLARLERSREWLKQYRKAADAVNRMNDKGEIPE